MKLDEFLAKLTSDPDFYARYRANKAGVIAESGLAQPDVDALMSGKKAVVRQRLQDQMGEDQADDFWNDHDLDNVNVAINGIPKQP